MKTTASFLIIALAFGLAAGAVPAQESQPRIRPGETLTVELPSGPLGEAFAEMTLEHAGGPVTIETRSLVLDVLVQLVEVDDAGTRRLVAGDDDSAGEMQDRLSFELEAGRSYRIVVHPVCQEWGGPVEVTVRRGRQEPVENEARREASRDYWAEVTANAQGQDDPLIDAWSMLGEASVAELDDDLQRARQLYDRLLELYRRERPADSPATAEILGYQGWLLRDTDESQQARDVFRRSTAILDSGAAAKSLCATFQLVGLAKAHMDLEEYESAIEPLTRAAAIRAAWLGPNHPRVANLLYTLGRAQSKLGRQEEARDTFEQVLSTRRAAFGDRHVGVADALSWLVTIQEELGSLEAAETASREAIPIYEEIEGERTERVARELAKLGSVLYQMERYEEALGFYERALAIRLEIHGETHFEVGRCLYGLGHTHWWLDQNSQAAAALERAVDVFETLGDREAWLESTYETLGRIYVSLERYADAKRAFERLLSLQQARAERPLEPDVASTLVQLASCKLQLGDRPDEVARLLEDALAAGDESPEENAEAAELVSVLSMVYLRAGNHPRALEEFDRGRAAVESHAIPELAWAARVLAQVALETGDPDEARRLLDLSGRWVPDAPLVQAEIHTGRGWIAYLEEDYATALSETRQALAMTEAVKGVAHPLTLDVLDKLARMESRASGIEAARSLLDAWRRRIDDTEWTPRPFEQDPYVLMGRIYSGLGLFSRAERMFEKALELRQSAFGLVAVELAPVLTLQARLYAFTGAHDKAELLARRALAIVEAHEGPEHEKTADQILELADVLASMERADEALDLLERAYAIRARVHGPDAVKTVYVQDFQASMYWDRADYAAAKELFEETLRRREATLGPDHPYVASNLIALAMILREIGAYVDARPLLERAIAIHQVRSGPRSTQLADAHTTMALLLEDQELYDEAREHAELSLEIREGMLEPDSNDVIWARLVLGRILLEMDRPEDARAVLETGFSQMKRRFQTDHPAVEKGFEHFQGMLAGETRYTDMGPLLRRAMPIAAARFGVDVPELVHGLGITAGTLRSLGASREAQAFYEWTYKAQLRSLGPDHPELASTLEGLAAVSWSLGKNKAALSHARRSAEILDRSMRDVVPMLSERLALRFVNSRQRPEVVLFSGLLSEKKRRDAWLAGCWEWALRRKALVLDELALRNQRALATESTELSEAWSRWLDTRARLAGLWVHGPDPSRPRQYRTAIEGAIEAREQAEQELGALSARFREGQRVRRAGLADVSRALPAKSALVEFVRVPVRAPASQEQAPHYVALLLVGGRGGKMDFADLGPAEALDGFVGRWREMLQESWIAREEPAALEELARAGTELRRAVWDPVAAKLGDVELVFMVPDGALHQVGFSALPARDGRFLVESGPTFHLLGSGRDIVGLLERESEPVEGQGVLILGDPDYDAERAVRLAQLDDTRLRSAFRGRTTDCPSLAQMQWERLPESGREARNLERLFAVRESTTLLTGAAASEERLKIEAPGKRVLHLATHGFFLQGDCVSVENVSRGMGKLAVRPIEVDSDPDKREVPTYSTVDNPLLLSGLVLAGANGQAQATPTEGEDGILTAEEIATLDLRGTELVVLSACETGRGRVEDGEGVFGLRRALESAGVRSMVISLWRVPDREATEWMEVFYGELLGGTPVSQASRRASLALLEELRSGERGEHPYRWAAFEAAGDWR